MISDSTAAAIQTLFAVLQRGGTRDPGGERVNQLEHALQCAQQAEQAGATPALVTAALLHDIGHLINPDDRAAFGRGEDARHEILGACYLEQWFGADVTEPVRLHVEAKRYLTATDAAYHDGLSSKSKRTLALQGGPIDSAQSAAFRSRAFAEDAVALRRWDDGGKVAGACVPALEHFEALVAAALK